MHTQTQNYVNFYIITYKRHNHVHNTVKKVMIHTLEGRQGTKNHNHFVPLIWGGNPTVCTIWSTTSFWSFTFNINCFLTTYQYESYALLIQKNIIYWQLIKKKYFLNFKLIFIWWEKSKKIIIFTYTRKSLIKYYKTLNQLRINYFF